LVQALLSGGTSKKRGKIDGEAFNIYDDSPLLFWEFARAVFGDTLDITQKLNAFGLSLRGYCWELPHFWNGPFGSSLLGLGSHMH